MFNDFKSKYVTKKDFEDLKNDVRNVIQDMTEIKAGIHLAKWGFVTAIAIIPIFTTVIEEFKDGLVKQNSDKTRILIKHPDGTYSVPEGNEF